jgi:glycosyltransferase involved in cell wall biosynthesis
MRVALIDPSLWGLPYDALLAAGLQAEGHEVSLHGRRLGPDDNDANGAPLVPSFYWMAEANVVTAMPKPLRLAVKGFEHALSMAALARRFKHERPNVIHFLWLPLPLLDHRFLSGLRRIAPLVLTVHDTVPFNDNPAASLQRLGFASGYRRFDRLIVHTEQGRTRLLQQGIAEDRMAMLPHGLLGAPVSRESGHGWQGEKITFLLFGKLKPYKGLDILIEAFAQLPKELQERARVLAIGKSYMDLAPLQARAQQLGVASRVMIEPRFVRDHEVAQLFGPDTVAMLPYREIEASGVLTVALVHGRPIIASRIGGFAETITDGVHGILVPPGNVAALASAMRRFLIDRAFAASCAHAVSALARSFPDWREIARRTLAVYRAAGASEEQSSASPVRRGRAFPARS